MPQHASSAPPNLLVIRANGTRSFRHHRIFESSPFMHQTSICRFDYAVLNGKDPLTSHSGPAPFGTCFSLKNNEARSNIAGKRAYRQEHEIITDHALCRCTALPTRQQRLLSEQQHVLGKDTIHRKYSCPEDLSISEPTLAATTMVTQDGPDSSWPRKNSSHHVPFVYSRCDGDRRCV